MVEMADKIVVKTVTVVEINRDSAEFSIELPEELVKTICLS